MISWCGGRVKTVEIFDAEAEGDEEGWKIVMVVVAGSFGGGEGVCFTFCVSV